MRSDLYFNNVPVVDFLAMEQVLFSYEGIPIVFVCMDRNRSRYLCVCDDVIDEESWLIVKISNTDLLDILNDKTTILSVYENKKVIVAARRLNQDIKYDITEYNDIDKDDLPVSDQYLEMKNSLKEYIKEIEYEILDSGLKLFFSSFEMSYDDLDVSGVAISLLKCNSKFRICHSSLENNEIKCAISNTANNFISVEANFIDVDRELCNHTEENVSIAYAA